MSRWAGLKKEDIGVLIRKYSKILRSLKSEYNKRNNVYDIDIDLPGELQKTSLNVLGILGISDYTVRQDALNLLERFYKYYEWDINHGAYTNELLAVCVVSEVLNYWNIEFNADYILDVYGLKKSSYINLSYKVNLYAQNNYWKN